MSNLKSKCCNANVQVGGKGSTHWWMCSNCGDPTDALPQTPSEDVLKMEGVLGTAGQIFGNVSSRARLTLKLKGTL